MVRAISSVSICFLIAVFVASIAASKERDKPPGEATSPEYTRHYEELLAIEERGEIEEALRKVPRILASDIPVDTFYGTLENKRKELLERLVRKGSFAVGTETYSFSDLGTFFTSGYLQIPDSCRFEVPALDELPRERFFYFMIALGRPHGKASSNPLLAYALPDFDPREGLRSADPWLASAALFLQRKSDKSLFEAREVIDRWQKRPALWDSHCTAQALLVLAEQAAEVLGGLTIENEDIRKQVETLKPVAPASCGAMPLYFDLRTGQPVSFPWSDLRLIRLETRADGTIEKEHPEDLSGVPISKKGGLGLPPGTYRLRIVTETYHGESPVFEAKKGILVRVPVVVVPSI